MCMGRDESLHAYIFLRTGKRHQFVAQTEKKSSGCSQRVEKGGPPGQPTEASSPSGRTGGMFAQSIPGQYKTGLGPSRAVKLDDQDSYQKNDTHGALSWF